MGSLKIQDLAEFQLRGKRLVLYPKEFPKQFPALLIGKLATDRNEEGKGGASHLVHFAVNLAIKLRSEAGCGFLTAHAYSDSRVIERYRNMGFKNLESKFENETTPMYMELL